METGAEPYILKVPGADNKEIVVQVYLPHELYWARIQEDGDVAQWCLGDEDIAAATGLGPMLVTWSADEDVVRVAGGAPGPLNRVAAFGIHGDGVQYNSSIRPGEQKSVVALSMNVISARSAKLRARRSLLWILQKGRTCNCGCRGWRRRRKERGEKERALQGEA